MVYELSKVAAAYEAAIENMQKEAINEGGRLAYLARKASEIKPSPASGALAAAGSVTKALPKITGGPGVAAPWSHAAQQALRPQGSAALLGNRQ
jgi:hypothetical protein